MAIVESDKHKNHSIVFMSKRTRDFGTWNSSGRVCVCVCSVFVRLFLEKWFGGDSFITLQLLSSVGRCKSRAPCRWIGACLPRLALARVVLNDRLLLASWQAPAVWHSLIKWCVITAQQYAAAWQQKPMRPQYTTRGEPIWKLTTVSVSDVLSLHLSHRARLLFLKKINE